MSDDLLEDQCRLVGPAPRTIVDAGTHHGHSSVAYLERFPEARVFAFEPEPANHAAAVTMLAPYGSRVALSAAAVSDADSEATLRVNTHHGTHSLLPIGDQRYWGGYVAPERDLAVRTVTLDTVAVTNNLGRIDILKMDIQGNELAALRGAERLLAERRIGLIATEVEFQALYQGQPLIWDIAAHLHGFGYGFYKLYDPYYHPNNPRVLSWADAIFLSPDLLQLPEWAHDR